MKIVLFDPYLPKFTQDMITWWEKQGHEVKAERYYNPTLIPWADVVWFDTCDNNLMSAMNPSEALRADWLKDGIIESDMHKMDLTGKKIIVRPIDIEVWQGHHANAKLWDLVTDCIFLAPHIRDIMMADSRPQESNMIIHIIPPGVDLNHWTFKERESGKKIAVVAERWVTKGVDYVIQIALKLPKGYMIHWLGQNNDYHWEHEYLLDMIKRHNLPITLHEDYIEDLDAWLDDKDYLLSASKKETFGYNIAEAMAKGIKPVVHEFFGYEPIWDKYTWSTIDQAVKMITSSEYNSKDYRHYLIEKGYTLDTMMEKFMAVIND